jgi:hypothetical protein
MLDYVNILSTSTYLLILFFVSNRVVDKKLARIFPHIDLSTNIFLFIIDSGFRPP